MERKKSQNNLEFMIKAAVVGAAVGFLGIKFLTREDPEHKAQIPVGIDPVLFYHSQDMVNFRKMLGGN